MWNQNTFYVQWHYLQFERTHTGNLKPESHIAPTSLTIRLCVATIVVQAYWVWQCMSRQNCCQETMNILSLYLAEASHLPFKFQVKTNDLLTDRITSFTMKMYNNLMDFSLRYHKLKITVTRESMADWNCRWFWHQCNMHKSCENIILAMWLHKKVLKIWSTTKLCWN